MRTNPFLFTLKSLLSLRCGHPCFLPFFTLQPINYGYRYYSLPLPQELPSTSYVIKQKRGNKSSQISVRTQNESIYILICLKYNAFSASVCFKRHSHSQIPDSSKPLRFTNSISVRKLSVKIPDSILASICANVHHLA